MRRKGRVAGVAAAALLVGGSCHGAAAAQTAPPLSRPPLSHPLPVSQARNSGDPDPAHDLSGVWWITDYARRLTPADGGGIPFTAAGRAAYRKNLAQVDHLTLADPGRTKCLPQGLPRTLFAPYPMQIVQHGTWVTFLHEVNQIFWSASLTDKHPVGDDLDPSFMGDAIGHWDGNVLVVDTVGFKDSFLDDDGMPHGAKLHVTSRIRRLDRQTLEISSTIEDPDFFTAPFTATHRYELRPDVVMQEFVCGEPHRALIGTRATGVQLEWTAK